MKKNRPRDQVLGHADEADGIEEYDNALPDWWLGLLWLTVIWAFAYTLHYHFIADRSQVKALAQELADGGMVMKAVLIYDIIDADGRRDLNFVVTDEMVQGYLKNAEDAEKQAREQMGTGGAVARNIEVLRRARPNVTDHMWQLVSLASLSGILGLHGLADPADTSAARNFREIRQVYTDALANRVTPGMEADKKPGEARPQVSTTEPAKGN